MVLSSVLLDKDTALIIDQTKQELDIFPKAPLC